MTSSGPRGTPARSRPARRESIVAWFQYAGAWALAIAWPVYQNIASGPEALTGVGARRLDLLLVLIAVSVVAPTILFLVEAAVRRLGPARAAEVFRAAAVGGLIALLVWQQLLDVPALLRYFLPLIVWASIVYGYMRSEFVRNFSEILGLAAPAVIVAFCLRYPIDAEVLPHEPSGEYTGLEADTPVVLVIFDELPLAALESSPEEVDERAFPNFSALAGTSTWYPDMLAVADQTTSAVPAILTGQAPDAKPATEPTPPGLPDHPNSVCTLAREGGYEVFAYEPITDVCARTYGLGTRVSSLVNRGVVTTELVPGNLEKTVGSAVSRPFRKPWAEYTEDRPAAVDSFLEGMPGTPGSISVLHIALPHVLWQFLPDGSLYNYESFPNGDTLVPGGEAATVYLQQHLLQLAYTDSELGRIIDRMKADGIWDDALMVVTADHGASFKPGSSRRILTGDNLGWNLPVPLFVKYPGQKHGKVVHGAVDSEDITPTILDVIGGEPSPDADGESLAGRKLDPATGPVTAKGYQGPVKAGRAELERQLDAARDLKNGTFGDGEFYALAGHPDLLGKRAASVRGLESIDSSVFNPELYAAVDPGSGFVPAFLKAEIFPAPGDTPENLAVAVNGKIAATAVAGQLFDKWLTGVTLPDTAFRKGANRIEFFQIPG